MFEKVSCCVTSAVFSVLSLQHFRGDKCVVCWLLLSSEWRLQVFERSEAPQFRNSLTGMNSEYVAHKT